MDRITLADLNPGAYLVQDYGLSPLSRLKTMKQEVEEDRRIQEKRRPIKGIKGVPYDVLYQPREVLSDQPTDWRDPTGLYWKLQL